MDSLDARILLALDDEPQASALALAARLGVARGTLSTRLQRMRQAGVLREFTRRIDPACLGNGLVAFLSIELRQASVSCTSATLRDIPEVVEMHSTTGDADLMVKVVAKDTADLHRITGLVLAAPGVVRTSTAISLCEEIPLRLSALIEAMTAS